MIQDSLKPFTQADYMLQLERRLDKMANVLDESDIKRAVQTSVRKLDEIVFSTRQILFQQDALTSGEGGSYFIDISQYDIASVLRVYYPPASFLTGISPLPEVGILPLIIGGGNFMLSSISDFIYYQQMLSNLGIMSRMYQKLDFYLWPPTADGKRFLQVRKPGVDAVILIEYLPSFDQNQEQFALFQWEDEFLQEYMFYFACLANCEYQLSAEILMGKAPTTQLDYFKNKLKELEDQYMERASIAGAFC